MRLFDEVLVRDTKSVQDVPFLQKSGVICGVLVHAANNI